MDTCVFIPEDFSLVLSLHPNQSNVLEMQVALWSNKTLHPGTNFLPSDGSVRLDRLEIYSNLPDDDIRRLYGGKDSVSMSDGRDVRHCNWVRFLKTSEVIDDANIVGMKVKDDIVFQVVKTILPNEEIVAFLRHPNNDTTSMDELLSTHNREAHTPDTPSTEKTEMKVSTASPIPFPSVRDMLTTPPPRDDDCKSSGSDVTHSGDEISPVTNSTHTPETERYSEPDLSPCYGRAFPQQESPLNLTSHRTPTRPTMTSDTSPAFTSPMTSSSRSPMTSPNSLPSPIAHFTSPPMEVVMRPKRNRERTWLPCDVCGKKFDRPSLLKRHMRTHTGEKPHGCEMCGKAFSTSSSLNTHRRIHSGEKPHQCGVCGKRFTASSNLYYHKMTHNKEKPHKCQLCSKSFPTPGDLRSHMYVHDGSWPYRCDVCNRGFSKQTNLKNHLLLHTGDKPHECPTCEKKFALYCNLKTHLKTHEDNQGSCTGCGRTFLKKNGVTSDRCSDCAHTRSPSTTPPAKRHLSDFSISKLTDSENNNKCKDHRSFPVVSSHLSAAMKDTYDSRLLSYYNPLMLMTPPTTPRYFNPEHYPIGYVPVYGGLASTDNTLLQTSTASVLHGLPPRLSLADNVYSLHSQLTSMKRDWTTGLEIK